MNGLDALARTLPTLLVIVGALLLLRHLVRRGTAGQDAGVRVLTRTGVAKGTVVAVVAVGDRRLVVGASEHGVSLLTELDPDQDHHAVRDDQVTEERGTTTSTDTASYPVVPDALAGLTPALLRRPTRTVHPDRPRMAPIDRLRHLTVRQPVPSHPRRSTGVHRRT